MGLLSILGKGIGQFIEANPPSGYGVAGWSDGVGGNYREIDGNVNVNAKLKALHKSNAAAAFSNNSQRKFVRTRDGWLHQVYESAGRVWLEHSPDDGSNWFRTSEKRLASGEKLNIFGMYKKR